MLILMRESHKPGLQGFQISLPSDLKKYLVTNLDGDIEYGYGSHGKDDTWSFIPVPPSPTYGSFTSDKGYHIVSNLYNLAIDYIPKEGNGEKIVARPYTSKNHTIWYISPGYDIYTISPYGDKRYLWTVSGKIYVTPDTNLVEGWAMIPLEGTDPLPPPVRTGRWRKDWILYFIVAILLSILAYVFVFKGCNKRKEY